MSIGQKIINFIRFLFIDKNYYCFCKSLKNKKLFILASSYSSISSMKQRPEHLMEFFLKDGYIVILPDKHFAKILEIEKNKFFCPYHFLPKLMKDKTLNKTFMSISTHYTLPHISNLYNKATKKGDAVIYEHLDDFELISSKKRKKLKNEFIKICRNNDIIISATADSLYDEAVKNRGSSKNIILLKNAVNIDDFKLNNIPKCPPEIMDVVSKKNL